VERGAGSSNFIFLRAPLYTWRGGRVFEFCTLEGVRALGRPFRNMLKCVLGETGGFIFGYESFFLICLISAVEFIDYCFNCILTLQIFPVGVNAVGTE